MFSGIEQKWIIKECTLCVIKHLLSTDSHREPHYTQHRFKGRLVCYFFPIPDNDVGKVIAGRGYTPLYLSAFRFLVSIGG